MTSQTLKYLITKQKAESMHKGYYTYNYNILVKLLVTFHLYCIHQQFSSDKCPKIYNEVINL